MPLPTEDARRPRRQRSTPPRFDPSPQEKKRLICATTQPMHTAAQLFPVWFRQHILTYSGGPWLNPAFVTFLWLWLIHWKYSVTSPFLCTEAGGAAADWGLCISHPCVDSKPAASITFTDVSFTHSIIGYEILELLHKCIILLHRYSGLDCPSLLHHHTIILPCARPASTRGGVFVHFRNILFLPLTTASGGYLTRTLLEAYSFSRKTENARTKVTICVLKAFLLPSN